jgi:hypothetical protein
MPPAPLCFEDVLNASNECDARFSRFLRNFFPSSLYDVLGRNICETGYETRCKKRGNPLASAESHA